MYFLKEPTEREVRRRAFVSQFLQEKKVEEVTKQVVKTLATELRSLLSFALGGKMKLFAKTKREDYHLHSGGAKGADYAFGVAARKYLPQQNIHHWFIGERSAFNAPYGNEEVSEVDKEEGAKMAAKAARLIFGYPHERMKDPRLLRNWCQVKYSDAIYAVGNIGKVGEPAFPSRNDERKLLMESVTGGTGYAVAMAMIVGKPIYVFDQKDNQWKNYDHQTKEWKVIEMPTLTKNFAGIGSRDLTAQGQRAINQLIAQLT